MRRESQSERSAWTAYIAEQNGDNSCPLPVNKYGAKRTFFNKRWYSSIHEAGWAANFQAMRDRGLIVDYKEQERIVLVPGNGKLRPIIYIADFVFVEAATGKKRVFDAKGYRTQLYRLKKKLAALLLDIEIEEV